MGLFGGLLVQRRGRGRNLMQLRAASLSRRPPQPLSPTAVPRRRWRQPPGCPCSSQGRRRRGFLSHTWTCRGSSQGRRIWPRRECRSGLSPACGSTASGACSAGQLRAVDRSASPPGPSSSFHPLGLHIACVGRLQAAWIWLDPPAFDIPCPDPPPLHLELAPLPLHVFGLLRRPAGGSGLLGPRSIVSSGSSVLMRRPAGDELSSRDPPRSPLLGSPMLVGSLVAGAALPSRLTATRCGCGWPPTSSSWPGSVVPVWRQPAPLPPLRCTATRCPGPGPADASTPVMVRRPRVAVAGATNSSMAHRVMQSIQECVSHRCGRVR